MIEIAPGVALDENEVRFEFTRASGPGGQNVNKVATAVQLRFDLAGSHLPEDILRRLRSIAGRRITKDDTLIIEARRHRSQEQNRRDALDRLVHLLEKAAREPKARKKTWPSAAARKKRLEEKKLRSERKKARRPVRLSDE